MNYTITVQDWETARTRAVFQARVDKNDRIRELDITFAEPEIQFPETNDFGELVLALYAEGEVTIVQR